MALLVANISFKPEEGKLCPYIFQINNHNDTFLPRDALLSAVYAVVVCLCVCVCPSHSGIVSKRLNVGSRKQRRTIAP